VAAFPDGRISAAVPDEVVSAAAKSDNASAAVPDQVASSSQPSEPANGGDRKCAEKRERRCFDAEETPAAKEGRVSSRAEAAATSNGGGHVVGIKNPTGAGIKLRVQTVAQWNVRFGELIEYKQKHGNCLVSTHDKSNKQLGKWVSHQRTQYRLLRQGKTSQMTTERIGKLEDIGFVWNACPGRSNTWNLKFDELMEYKWKRGDCNVPREYEPNKQLGIWVNEQRAQYHLFQQGKCSTMTIERIAKLAMIGFRWDVPNDVCIINTRSYSR